MTAALLDVVIGLAAVVVLLNGAIVATRVAMIRRQKRLRRLRPGIETLLAEYLAGTPAVPSAATPRERAVLLDVALEAITDLRGEERVRLVGLLEELGFVSSAMSGLSARRRVSRRRAAEVLATIGSRAAVGALTAALGDLDALVAVTCAYTLAEIGGEDVVPAVTATIVRHAVLAPGTTAAAMLALGTKRPSALAPLLARDVAATVRMTAIGIVSGLRLPQYLPTLRACLTDTAGTDSDGVAASAARGLGLIGDAEAVEALIELASDTSRTGAARAAAAQALGSIGDSRAVPVLAAQLRARDWTVRAAATGALGGLGEPGIAVLRRAASSGSAEVRLLAEAALQP
jgi:HEAT repeat protein